MGNRALVVAESARRRLLIHHYLEHPKQTASERLQTAFDRQPKLRRGFLELQQIYEVLHHDFGVVLTPQELEPFLLAIRCTASRIQLTSCNRSGPPARWKPRPAQKADYPDAKNAHPAQSTKVVLVYSYQPIVSFVAPRELSFYYRMRPEDDGLDHDNDPQGIDCSDLEPDHENNDIISSADAADASADRFMTQMTIWQAAKTGHLEAIRAMCSADWNTDVSSSSQWHFCAKDENGNTPLYYASLCGHEHVVDFLLKLHATHGMVLEHGELLRCVTNALNVSTRQLLQGKTTLETIQKQRAAQAPSQSKSPTSCGSRDDDNNNNKHADADADDEDDGKVSLPELFGDQQEV